MSPPLRLRNIGVQCCLRKNGNAAVTPTKRRQCRSTALCLSGSIPATIWTSQVKKKKSASATADAVTFLTCPPNERKLPQKPIAKQCAKLLPITSFIQATKTQQTSASIEPTPWLKIGRQFLAYEWSDITEKQDGRLLAFSLPLKLGYIWATALVQRPISPTPFIPSSG